MSGSDLETKSKPSVDKETVIAYNKKKYGDLIRAKRLAKGLTPTQFAEKLGVAKNLVAHWEAGRARPDMNIIPKLCGILDLSISGFFGIPGTESELTHEQRQHLRKYGLLRPESRRVIDKTMDAMLEVESQELARYCKDNFIRILNNDLRVCAGMNNTLDEHDELEYIYIRADSLSRRADELITVTGNSMEPTYYDGDVLMVQHTRNLDYGDIGIFVVNGEGFVKEYREDGLYSHNYKSYPFRRFKEYDEVYIIGKVLGKLDDGYYPDEQEKLILDEQTALTPT